MRLFGALRHKRISLSRLITIEISLTIFQNLTTDLIYLEVQKKDSVGQLCPKPIPGVSFPDDSSKFWVIDNWDSLKNVAFYF